MAKIAGTNEVMIINDQYMINLKKIIHAEIKKQPLTIPGNGTENRNYHLTINYEFTDLTIPLSCKEECVAVLGEIYSRISFSAIRYKEV